MEQEEADMTQDLALPTPPTTANDDFSYHNQEGHSGNYNIDNQDSSDDSDWESSDNDSDSSSDDEMMLRILDEIRRYLVPDDNIYNKNNMVTQSVVSRVLELGNVKLSKESLGNQEVQTRTRCLQIMSNKRRDALAIAVCHAKGFIVS